MSSTRILGFVLLALTVGPSARAGQDFQLWSKAGLEVRISKRWRIEFDQHLRLEKNLTAIDSVMPELAITYRVKKFLRIEAGYRAILEPIESLEDTYFETWHRFFAGARLSHRLKPFTIKYRLQVEEEFGWPWKEDETLTNKHTIRNLFGAEMRLPGGLIPSLSCELFLRVADPDGALHKWRATAGLEFKFGRHTLGLFYRIEDPIADTEDPTRHILGTGYHFTF